MLLVASALALESLNDQVKGAQMSQIFKWYLSVFSEDILHPYIWLRKA